MHGPVEGAQGGQLGVAFNQGIGEIIGAVLVVRFENQGTSIIGGGAVERLAREMGVAAVEIDRDKVGADQPRPVQQVARGIETIAARGGVGAVEMNLGGRRVEGAGPGLGGLGGV